MIVHCTDPWFGRFEAPARRLAARSRRSQRRFRSSCPAPVQARGGERRQAQGWPFPRSSASDLFRLGWKQPNWLRDKITNWLWFTKREAKGPRQSSHSGCSPKDGGLFGSRGSGQTGLRCQRRSEQGNSLEPPHGRKGIYTARRPPGPARGRLGEGEQSPDAPSDCFGTGGEHKLNLL